MPRITLALLTTALASVSGLALALLGGWFDSPREEYFAQVAVHGGGTTAFLLHNPGHRTVRVDVELRDGRGRLFEDRNLVLPAGATLREEFGGEPGEAVAGWARVRGDGPFVATELIRAGPSPWVGVLASRPTRKFRLFGMVDVPGLRTGVAVANPNAEPSLVQARLYGEDGSLLRSTEFELAAMSHRSGCLDDYFPDLGRFQGMAEFSSSRPLVATTVRSDRKLLATVPVVALE